MKKTTKLLRWVALMLLSALTVWLSLRIAVGPSDPWNSIIPLATLMPAWVVLLRRDWHLVGWLLAIIAAISAAQFSEVGSSDILTPEWIAWIYTVLNVAFWALMATLVAVFPDGVSHQQGWPRTADRIIVWLAVALTAISAFGAEVQAAGWEAPTDPPLYSNPLGVGFLPFEAGLLLTLGAILLFIASTVTLVVRTRRATGAVRQQYRWVLFPFAILVFGVPVAIVVTEVRGEPGPEWLIAVLAYVAIPICFGVAMTRYRLYDIGKLISRTVSYASLVLVLGALYFGAIALLTALLPTQNSLVVAAATLGVAAIFNPMRKRIQGAVDRRFNRSAFEATVISDAFNTKLKDPHTIDELTQLWASTVEAHLQPVSSGVWISGSDR